MGGDPFAVLKLEMVGNIDNPQNAAWGETLLRY